MDCSVKHQHICIAVKFDINGCANDGIVWNETQIWGAYLSLGAATNDTLLGTTGNDVIDGLVSFLRPHGPHSQAAVGF